MKKKYANVRPYGNWLAEEVVSLQQLLDSVPESVRVVPPINEAASAPSSTGSSGASLLASIGNGTGVAEPPRGVERLIKPLRAAGYTVETLEMLLLPMARTASEPLGSMGNDAPLAAMSQRPKLLYEYFKQLFAQVGWGWGWAQAS